VAKNWRTSKFGKWVDEYGIEQLADTLEIDGSAIRHWLRGRSSPDIVHASRIQGLARDQGLYLSIGDIYELRSAVHSKRGITNSFKEEGSERTRRSNTQQPVQRRG
jgi:hypothetical protein